MIESWGIRSRVILVAVLPMLVLALLLTGFYTTSRLADLEEAYNARGKAFARQLVAASEYAVFSGNRDALQQLTTAIQAEEGVTSVMIVDRLGEALALSGTPGSPHEPSITLTKRPGAQVDGVVVRIVEPIVPVSVKLDENLTTVSLDDSGGPEHQPILGHVVLELSLDHLDASRMELLRTGGLTILIALLATLMLAIRMSNGVSTPIRQVASTVNRIGQGRFDERVPTVGGGSLRTLAEGVNDMASELASMHTNMQRRIEDATSELRTRKEEAERANLAKSRFLAAASHDLRQPMHALSLFIGEFSQQKLDARSTYLLKHVAASAEAMEDLLDSLLDISKLDAGALEPGIRPFALQPLLDRVEASLRPTALEKGLELKTRPTLAWASSDPVLFERILSNLLSNAVRHTRTGRVLVACRRRGSKLRLEVRDSGVGIPLDSQSVIFQEFVQLDNPGRTRERGLGLGLAIVRKLTDLLAHPLYLNSAPGRGSVFSVEMPACAPLPERLTGSDQAREPGDLAGLKVAVIDNDPLARAAIEGLLLSWNCEVTACVDHHILIDALSRHGPPNLVISDYHLAGSASGMQAIAALRQRFGASLPAALITGDTGPETLRIAQEAGLPVLHKPVRPARLRALLNRIAASTE